MTFITSIILTIVLVITRAGKPADLYNDTNPDWAPSVLMDEEPRSKPKEGKTSDECETNIKRYKSATMRKDLKDQHAAAQALMTMSFAGRTGSSSYR